MIPVIICFAANSNEQCLRDTFAAPHAWFKHPGQCTVLNTCNMPIRTKPQQWTWTLIRQKTQFSHPFGPADHHTSLVLPFFRRVLCRQNTTWKRSHLLLTCFNNRYFNRCTVRNRKKWLQTERETRERTSSDFALIRFYFFSPSHAAWVDGSCATKRSQKQIADFVPQRWAVLQVSFLFSSGVKPQSSVWWFCRVTFSVYFLALLPAVVLSPTEETTIIIFCYSPTSPHCLCISLLCYRPLF